MPGEPDHLQFHIAAGASFRDRPPHTLKHGDSFAVFDERGDMCGAPGSTDGLYDHDTRMLSRLELSLEGCRPLLLSSMTQADNAMFTADLTNPDLYLGDTLVWPRELIHVQRMKFVWQNAYYERVLVRNFATTPRRIHIALAFAADFADLFEVRGMRRIRHGSASASRMSEREVSLRYRGLDQVERCTQITFDPAPTQLDEHKASFEIELRPYEARRLFLRVGTQVAATADWTARSFYKDLRAARHALHGARERGAKIESNNSLFDEVMRRAIADIHMLLTDTPLGPYPYAGTPWFSTPFGRDGLITALMTLWFDPAIARGVLRFLAANQADAEDPERDAQPGKILHELRGGEMARLREVPFERYYGSVDATPLFVFVLGEYFERSGDLALVRSLWPNVLRALEWIDRYGDSDGDGFVEYSRVSREGLVNQGWKDSHDAIFDEDGRDVEPPVALCEVQAYVYGAKRHAARMADALGYAELSTMLSREAELLRSRFEEVFWLEDLSIYAMALDGKKRPCRVVSSNAGQTLLTGIASPKRARRVAQTLIAPASFSGWGIRTVSRDAARYNPMSYHNGSIWPHDNALIAMGFARYGLKSEVLQVFQALFEAATHMELRRLPELYCGFPRRLRTAPTHYPVACSPQAWACASLITLIQASLGLSLQASQGQVHLDQPALPAFLNHLCLRRLLVNGGRVDLSLHRQGKDVAVTVIRRDAGLRVEVSH